VQLTFRPDTAVIEARSDGRARAVESVPVRYAGAEQVISFNPHYLLDGLTAAMLSGHGPHASEPGSAGSGRVRLEFTSPAKPALITWAGSAEEARPDESPDEDTGAFRYLVVPLRAPAAG
jgi:DNA polymerase III sliding clamp (beta) subunit (PCNA family)